MDDKSAIVNFIEIYTVSEKALISSAEKILFFIYFAPSYPHALKHFANSGTENKISYCF